MRSNVSLPPDDSASDASILPRSSKVLKMPSAGGQVPRQIEAPASARALAMANPNPPSSATPATSARFPTRSMLSMRAVYHRRSRQFTVDSRQFRVDGLGGL